MSDVQDRARAQMVKALSGSTRWAKVTRERFADDWIERIDAAGIVLVDASELERLREELDQVLVMLKPIIDKINARAAVGDTETRGSE